MTQPPALILLQAKTVFIKVGRTLLAVRDGQSDVRELLPYLAQDETRKYLIQLGVFEVMADNKQGTEDMWKICRNCAVTTEAQNQATNVPGLVERACNEFQSSPTAIEFLCNMCVGNEHNKQMIWASTLFAGGWNADAILNGALTLQINRMARSIIMLTHSCVVATQPRTVQVTRMREMMGNGGGSGLFRAILRALLENNNDDDLVLWAEGIVLEAVMTETPDRIWQAAQSIALGWNTNPEHSILAHIVWNAIDAQNYNASLVEFLCFVIQQTSSTEHDEVPKDDADILRQDVHGTAIAALASATAHHQHWTNAAKLRLDIVQCVVPLIRDRVTALQPGRRRPGTTATVTSNVLEANLLRTLANVCSGDDHPATRAIQDLVRDLNGLLPVVRFSLTIDANNPSTRRECAVFALRALTADNVENQRVIADARMV